MIYLCRHGETAWTLSHKHTGLTDMPLTEKGREQARLLRQRLPPCTAVYSSPLQRALESCRLAGQTPRVEPDAVEWNYGAYEGLTSAEIYALNPTWTLFSQGAPGGESVDQVYARAGRLLAKLTQHPTPVALFSHGHFLRVLTARWLGLPPQDGRLFTLNVASLSALGHEHDIPTLHLWNDTSHLAALRA